MGRTKNTSAFEQRLIRLRYDKAARAKKKLLAQKKTNWSINSPRDGISDLIAKELAQPEPPYWYTDKILAKTNAIWRIGVGDRSGFSSRKLREQRQEDIDAVKKWMLENVEDEDFEKDIIKYLGLTWDEKYEYGPLGGSRPTDVNKHHKQVRPMITPLKFGTDIK